MNTPDNPFIIPDKSNIPQAEYKIIDSLLDPGYTLKKQSITLKNNTFVDRLDIYTQEGKMLFFYFDVSSSF